MASPVTQPRNLVLVGAFTCVFVVVTFAAGMLGALSPLMIFIGGLIGMLINSIVVMLYLAKVPHFGALTIMGVVLGLFLTLTGSSWITLITCSLFGLGGDFVARMGSYHAPMYNAAGYAVFQLWALGMIAPIIIDTEGYIEHVSTLMNNPAYGDAMRELLSPVVLYAWLPVNFIVCFLCGLLGMRILRKHFVPAGVA